VPAPRAPTRRRSRVIGLLVVTLAVALAAGTVAALVFLRPMRRILQRIVADDITSAWVRYLVFAMYVVGVGGGVNIRQIERYITAQGGAAEPLVLTLDRWIIEIYSSGIGALGAITWLLLVFFVFALIAYVVVRALELKRREPALEGPEAVREGASFP
jgi:hypothetical protein